MAWANQQALKSQEYRCGHCGYIVASDRGYAPSQGGGRCIYLCPHCEKPSFFDELNRQHPGVAPGDSVLHVPKDLAQLYLEARNCCSVSAYTASVLASRKMLMNIAVQQGAKEGLKFIEYVEYLATNGFIPPNGKSWVDHIRKKGNEATHEIALMTQADSNELIVFTEMLLKFIFEFPNRVPGA